MSVMNTYKKTSKPSTKKSNAASSESAQERALNLFAEMMIEKIESIQQDWKKPWFTEGAMQCNIWGGTAKKEKENCDE